MYVKLFLYNNCVSKYYLV